MTDLQHKRKRALLLALCGVALAVAIFTISPARQKPTFRINGVVWNTAYHITYSGTADLSDSVTATLRRVELSVSPFNKASLITAINENRTDSLDAALALLYARSRQINEESGGAFDPTVAPIVNAWGFGFSDQDSRPDAQAIDSLRQFVGIGKTRVERGRLIKDDPRTTFNFSAIAKGYGCDEVGRTLERNGVENYMVEIGGEIAVKGLNGRGEKWRISIDKPIESADSVVHESAEIIAVSDCGIATSGNYRNFETDDDGNRYSHIINPATGYPARTSVLSATVVASDCMTADAYATTLIVVGEAAAKRLAGRHPELAAMLIVGDGKGGYSIWRSPAFKKLVAGNQ